MKIKVENKPNQEVMLEVIPSERKIRITTLLKLRNVNNDRIPMQTTDVDINIDRDELMHVIYTMVVDLDDKIKAYLELVSDLMEIKMIEISEDED